MAQLQNEPGTEHGISVEMELAYQQAQEASHNDSKVLAAPHPPTPRRVSFGSPEVPPPVLDFVMVLMTYADKCSIFWYY